MKKKLKKCAACGTQFQGEAWRTYCVECFKAMKTEETRVKKIRQGARLTAPIDARKGEVLKAKRRLKVVLPDKNRQDED